MKGRRTIVLGTLLMALAVLVLASGCYPLEAKMSYQGRLTNPQGTPLAGTQNVTFRLRGPMPGAGTPTPTVVWSESKAITANDNGLFNTVLGDTALLDVEDFSQRLFLEVEIEGEALSPRQELLGAPYAFSLVPGALVVGAITPAPTPRAVLNVLNLGGVGVGAQGNPAILASGSIKSTAKSYIHVPGGHAVVHATTTGVNLRYWGRGTVTVDPTTGGDKTILFPVTLPSELYGQAVRVEEVTIWYTSAEFALIKRTCVYRQKADGGFYTLVCDETDHGSMDFTSYSVTPTADNVLSPEEGFLTVALTCGVELANTVTLGGVRVQLGHYEE